MAVRRSDFTEKRLASAVLTHIFLVLFSRSGRIRILEVGRDTEAENVTVTAVRQDTTDADPDPDQGVVAVAEDATMMTRMVTDRAVAATAEAAAVAAIATGAEGPTTAVEAEAAVIAVDVAVAVAAAEAEALEGDRCLLVERVDFVVHLTPSFCAADIWRTEIENMFSLCIIFVFLGGMIYSFILLLEVVVNDLSC